MKLTAPPPGSAPEQPLEPTADAPATPEAPSPAIPYQKPPDRLATWPTWFGPADVVLAVAVLALAFLAASFAARNSDIWLHLASGKRLLAGEYKLGTDPFSYTGADRTWVNHSWLWDAAAYSLYSGDGSLLVILKALFAAAAFGLVLAIRRAGQPMWPWTIFALFAVLASANMLSLRPFVGSFFFLALTLLLVFRLPSRRMLPVAIAVTFALWSNLDAWFVLGPATLLLLAIGEGIRSKMWPDAVPEPADSLGIVPDLKTLAKCLILGSVGCMINPHHIGVWEVPFELLGAPGAENDPRIAFYFLSPARSFTSYWSSPSSGFNAGGLSYAFLLLAGVYVSFLSGMAGRLLGFGGVDPLPVPQLALVLGFGALSLLTFFAIPFFALVMVPILASRCNVASSQIVLGVTSDGGTRLRLMASSVGRIATVLSLLILGLIAKPGWLHPPASAWWDSGLTHPSNSRRVEWRVEADPELQQGAEWLQSARASGALPAETRGLVASLDFANHCAWFAPSEKVFANGRIAFHRADLPDLAKARRGLGAYLEKAEPPDPRDLEEVLLKWKAAYVVIAWPQNEREVNRYLLSQQELLMWLDLEHWSPWFFNGRSAISGWRSGKQSGEASFRALELDPLVRAYGPEAKRLPNVSIMHPLVYDSAWGELFTPRQSTPLGAEEAEAWLRFKGRAALNNQIVQQTGALLRLNQPGLAAPVIPQTMFLGRDEFFARQRQLRLPPPADGSFRTYPILALRAARQAIAENPDHPDGYFALAQVLDDRDLPIGEGDRAVSVANAYQQCLARLPKPADFRRNMYLASPTQAAESLAMLFVGRRFPSGDLQGHRVDMGMIGEASGAGVLYRVPASPATGNRQVILRVPQASVPQLPQGSVQLASGLHILPLDLAQQLLATAEEYAKVEFIDPERRTSELSRIADERKIVDAAHRKALEQFRTAAERAPKLRDRHRLAMANGLVGEALNLLNNADLGKEYGEEEAGVYFHLVAVELAVGRFEDATNHLATLRSFISELSAKPDANKPLLQSLKRMFSELEFQRLVLEGNYAEAGKELEALEGSQVGIDELLAALAKEKIDPAVYHNTDKVGAVLSSMSVAWPMFAMFGIPVYGPGEPLSAFTAYMSGLAGLSHFQTFESARQAVANKMQRDSEFFFRRGFLALLEGDIAGAKARFASAARPAPPPAWKILPVRHADAELFLKQIERAEKAKKP
ncbi:MAG: hypothetical protein U0791_11465 [Gemmataceae bacterium]